MATHYLIDAHNPTILSSEINDVRYSTSGPTDTTGNFVVAIPDGVKLESDPTDLSDLLNKKYAALLAEFPGYSNIVYDDCLDATDFSVTANERAKLGSRGNIGIGVGVELETSSVPLGQTVSQYVIIVGLNRLYYSYTPDGRILRYYEDDLVIDPGLQVSTNGGTNFTAATNGQVNQIGSGFEGTDLVIQFAPPFEPSDDRLLYINSWALIY